VQLFELSDSLAQTGRSFASSVVEDTGAFEINASSSGNRPMLGTASGFYYAEVAGALSNAQLSLSAYGIPGAPTFNINVLGHLASERIEALVAEGQSFAEAKAIAEQEVMAAVGLGGFDGDAQSVGITGEDTSSARMLALSIAVQGFGGTAELTERLARLRADLADGSLDDAALVNDLTSTVTFANEPEIRSNLESYYADRGTSVQVPDFETQLAAMRASTPGTATEFAYPERCENGYENALPPDFSAATTGDPVFVCLGVEVPAGAELRLVYRDTSVPGRFPDFLELPETEWLATYVDAGTLEFLTVGDGYREIAIDVHMAGKGAGSAEIDIYEERGSATPTRTQHFTFLIQ
jgi:hypothetical protein